MAVFQIAHLYPETMNIGGDRGNILCLEKRLFWRGIECRTEQIHPGDEASFDAYDLLYIGGGEDFDTERILQDLRSGRGEALRAAIENGLPVLAIGGGLQILGQKIVQADGTEEDYVGALDMITVFGKEQMIGNYVFRTEERSGDVEVVGFENHFGKILPGSGVEPLGHVVKGYGNNGEDGTEGIRYKNVFGSNGHGPLLPKNAAFCDHILQTAWERKGSTGLLTALDDGYENLAHDTVRDRILAGTDTKDE